MLLPNLSAAQNKQQAERELKELKQVIANVQKELQQNRQQQSQTEKKIQVIDQALAKASNALRQTEQQIASNKKKLAQLNREKSDNEILRNNQRKQLATQLKSAYMSGQQEYIKLLLNQEDPAKISRMLQYYKYLNQARIDDIKALQLTLIRLQELKQDIQSTLFEQQQLAAEQQKQKDEQVNLKAEQKSTLDKLKKEYKDQNSRLAKLQRDEQSLQKIINSIQKKLQDFAPEQSLSGLSKFKKKLNWPVNGKILHRYGSSKFENKLKWNGIVISASEGAQVQAIHHGQVVFSDWLRGFGLVTIIDHGKGYLSLYGQNQSLLKTAGDWVEAGEPIASAGQSGGSNSSGLYFEIRYNGKPQNPTSWIK
ncbi:MAG: peptidoglycan DD-metalloendopeptidase family protein [Kangiellaceae bacterium]|nr:peptidoglycan DD-metalloendopeptidase family protein [Kangiellaceae bacterium]